jgi:ectoine hydroxylase-related dioxygenase (phytanoyl-CoA dioxygenase family)
MITAEQLAYFETFGYLVLRQAFSREEAGAISEEFDRLLDEERQGAPFPGETRQSLYGIAERSALLTGLVEDDRIYETVEGLFGPGFLWLCSEGNLYVGDTTWHPDGTNLDYTSMKVSLYLDPLTRDTGCLRVIPGSHKFPFHEDLKPSPQSSGTTWFEKFGMEGSEVPARSLESEPGDVLFMDCNIWHAAFGGVPGRRHLAVNFVPEPKSEENVAKMRSNYEGDLERIKTLQYSQPGRLFTDEFLHSDRPRIQRLASKWVELGLN